MKDEHLKKKKKQKRKKESLLCQANFSNFWCLGSDSQSSRVPKTDSEKAKYVLRPHAIIIGQIQPKSAL